MKKALKILSLFCALVLIIGTVSVGMSAYAVSDDVIGDYDFQISNVYKDVNWSTVKAYKAETHVHTERSDGDQHVRDMIRKYYELGYDAMCLTDHGTVNYGWTDETARLAIFDYQFFVHGSVMQMKTDEYREIITGTKARSINSGKGMMELPLGIELNGMSTNKCHVNGFYADAGHGDLEITTSWPESAVIKNYEAGGFTHINHVGEWSEGNDSALVYSSSWLRDFTNIYFNYCPNRGGRDSATQTAWMNSHNGEAGCIGMELVNTADSRTHNDRRYVYDEILKRLAPQGINVFGFCEDDSHEYSDCDRNAQYFLISDDVAVTSSQYTGVGCQRIKDVQKIYRDAMFYGEFYACSKNSKNSYELGNGFSAQGNYPSVSNIQINQEKNQIIVSCKDATKVRMIADGEIIETKKTSAAATTVTFDLNSNESKINSYVRIYLTGAGGITYLQPFLVTKTASHQSTVQFLTPSSDTQIVVKDNNGSVVSDSLKYANNYYKLPAGDYTYTASRNGYITKTEGFTVNQQQIDDKEQIKITVELEEQVDTTYAYFYVPETIYVDPATGKDFDKYIDRENAIAGALHADPQDRGNVYFYREGATDISLSYSVYEGNTSIESLSLGSSYSSYTEISTQITGGKVAESLQTGQYVLIRWTATYTYKEITYYNYAYSYVYKLPVDNNSVLGAGAMGRTKKNVTDWWHTTMQVTASVYVVGCHELVSTNLNGYKYNPYSSTPFVADNGPTTTGKGYAFTSEESSGGSRTENVIGDTGIIHVDRSRVNDYSEIPYLMVGLDLNNSDQCTGEDGSDAYAYLFFDNDSLLNINFSGQSSYTRTIVYGGTSQTETFSASNMLTSLNGTRLYQSDNRDSGKKLVRDLPPYSTDASEIEIKGQVKGTKASRADEIIATVKLQIENCDKSSLRMQVNDTIKYAYQKEWFENEKDWNTYQSSIAAAAKILGNPAATPEDIDDKMSTLEDAEDALIMRTGTATVKHYWKFGTDSQTGRDITGLIFAEDSYTYNYSDNLTASAVEITGYSYANYYECYVNGELVDSSQADFDTELASKENYEWRFYYIPGTYTVRYKTGVGAQEFSPSDGGGYVANFGQDYVITSGIPERSGYTFAGWYLDAAQQTYASSQTIKWNYATDADFIAQWDPITYNVSYDVNGGNPITVPDEYKTVAFGTSYSIVKEVPTKTGYYFTGWKLNDGEIHTAGSRVFWDAPTDSTFVAQWSPYEYEVTFDPVEDDAVVDPTSKTVTYDDLYGTLATARRDGYYVTWYSDPNYASSSVIKATDTVKIPSDHTLYAKWAPIIYNISYNLEGGAVTGKNPDTYTIEDSTITLKNPTKVGYKFLGWSGTDIPSTEYQTTVVIPAGSIGTRSYTAHWSIDGYSITYNLDGGINDSRNPATYTVNDAVSIYPATKSGYHFDGWYGSNGDSPQTSFAIPGGSTGNKTYNAKWTIIDYDIDYEYAGGTPTAENPTTYNVTTDDFEIAEPVRPGYTFYGWQCNNSKFSTLYPVITKGTTGDLSFTALWSNNDYRITYAWNGGNVVEENPIGYTTGDEFTLINPTRAGYTFIGWKKTISGVTQDLTMESGIVDGDIGDVLFEAFWTANPYNITYSLNGGYIAQAGSNKTVYTPDDESFTLINPVRTGYEFTGWTGTDLESNYMSVTVHSGSYGDREYNANWRIINYSVSYDFNGGADVGLLKIYNVLTDTEIGAPVKLGYQFTGWDISYENFTWTQGNINEATGKFEAADNSYYSEAIVLRQGRTYSLNTGATGGTSDLRLAVYNLDGTGYESVSPDNYTATKDCVAFIVAFRNHTSEAVRSSVSMSVVGTPLSYYVYLGSTGNMHFVANWHIDTYSITCNLNGGEYPQGVSNPESYDSESEDIVLKNPQRIGYEFLGWEYEGRVTNPAVIPKGSTGNREYNAVWNIANYSISYSGLAGASATSNPVTYNIETPTFTLQNPSKTGYRFDGWVGTDVSGPSTEVTIYSGSIGNRSFTATWTPLSYTISYDFNGGSEGTVANPKSYTIETPTFSLSYPVKTGAVFAGWTGTDVGSPSLNVSIPKGSIGNRSFTATWTVNTYEISYDLDGGVEGTPANPNPTTYTVESPDILLTRPVRTGYAFAGWTGTGLKYITEYVTIPTGSTGHRSYTANWISIMYTINYTLNGGAVADNINPREYSIESTTFTLANPVRSGYIFAGWSGTDITGMSTNVVVPKGSHGNRAYEANWTVDGYNISYDLDEGVLSSANPTFYTITTDDFTLNNPTRAGYEFLGWSGTGISGSGISKTVTIPKGSTGNRTYTANWSLVTYSISYSLNGGSAVLANPTKYSFLSAPITVFAPVRVGYVFLGWESNYYDGVQQNVVINTGSTGDKEFSAVWGEGNYTISYNLNGGTVDGVNPDGYSYTTPTFTLINPTKEGYIFLGWSGTNITGTQKTVTIGEGSMGNRSYVANWTSSTNALSYDLNGGEVSGNNPDSYITNSGILTIISPTRKGYRFAGWTVDQHGKDIVKIDSNTLVATIDTKDGGSVDFTANWTPESYSIRYNLNGGSVSTPNPSTYTVDTNDFTLVNPTREGYNFVGWSGTGLGSYKYETVNILKGSTGKKSFTANWEEVEYKITYDYNGGSTDVSNPTKFTVLSSAIILKNPVKPGYNFIGWTGFNGETPEMVVSIPAGSTGDRSYKANYDIVPYSISYYGIDGSVFNRTHTGYLTTDSDISIENPYKPGFEFLGWKGTDLLHTTKNLVIPTGSTGDKEYTAQWTANEYSVGYKLNGGSVAGDNVSSYTTVSPKVSLLNPTKPGYSFNGWIQTYDFSTFDWIDGYISMPAGKFEKNNSSYPNAKYSEPFLLNHGITYNITGVSSGSVMLCLFNENLECTAFISSLSYTPAENCICFILDYNDIGDSARKGIKISTNLQSISSINPGSMGDIVYEAQWSAQNYTVAYSGLTGATIASNPTTYNAEQSFTLNNPTRNGYEFLGWTGTGISSMSKSVTVPVGSSGNRTYVANWRAISYVITVSLNGGTLSAPIPGSYNISSDDIVLPTPKKSGYTFAGWTGTGIGSTPAPSVTIRNGSTGNRSYEAVWEQRTSGSHRIYFYGYDNQPIILSDGKSYLDIPVGQAIVPPTPPVTVGYMFKSWDIDVTSDYYRNLVDDIEVHGVYVYDSKEYSIIVNTPTEVKTINAKQYDQVTVSAEVSNGSGKEFSYWIDADTNEIVSYYRNYTFYVHSNATLTAVYGVSTSARAATRITTVEGYKAEYDWFTVYTERSVSSEYTLLQHGLIFTNNASVGSSESGFVIGAANVNNGVASTKGLSGIWTLSIKNPAKYSGQIYLRSYVKVADQNGKITVKYSAIQTYANNEDPSA